jgi:hypothetical protein
MEMHFFKAPDVDPLTTAAGCYAFVEDAQALYDECLVRVGSPLAS